MCIFRYKFFVQCVAGRHFHLVCGLSLDSLNSAFCRAEVFNFLKSDLSIFFHGLYIWCYMRKTLHQIQSHLDFLLSLLEVLQHHIFLYFELTFVTGVSRLLSKSLFYFYFF